MEANIAVVRELNCLTNPALIDEDEDELKACNHTLKLDMLGISTLCCLAA
jgi:hypothetical protein